MKASFFEAQTLRLLFVLPFPPDLAGSHGGARVLAATIEMLARSHEVAVFHLSTGPAASMKLPVGCWRIQGVRSEIPKGSTRPFLSRLLGAVRTLIWDQPDWAKEVWSPRLSAAIAHFAAEFDPAVVHFEFHVMSQYIDIVRRAAPGAACIVTEHEPGIRAGEVTGSGGEPLKRRLSKFAQHRAWTRFERHWLPRADAVVTFTEQDKDSVVDLIGSNGPEVVSIPFRLPLTRTWAVAAPSGHNLLFVGNFNHPPNADAARRLVAGIFPQIKEEIPAATLTIIGSDPPPNVVAAAGPGIVFTGWVDDTSQYFRHASIVMAPLRQGGGMRVKIVEASSFGKAIIASALAIEGLGLRDGVECIVADSDDAFATTAIKLLQNRERIREIGMAASRWAGRTQDSAAWLADYERLYARLFKPREASSISQDPKRLVDS